MAVSGQGRLIQLTRATLAPLERSFSWGTIRAIDRLEVFNSFLTFGGRVRLAAVDASTTIAAFDSPAPIVRWSGHSQSVDALTGEIGAFFARMMIPIDFMPGAEQRIADATPARALRVDAGRPAAPVRHVAGAARHPPGR